MVNILIVDDHAIVRRGLMQILTDEPDIEVTEVGNPRHALSLICEKTWDLVVLDLDLPEMSGLDLLKEIKRLKHRLPVLILSVHPEDQFAIRTLKAGASGFMSKDAAPEELVKTIRKVLRGGKYISEKTAEKLLSNLDDKVTEAPHDSLTDREFQILRLIGRGKTVSEIAAELSLSVPTVSTYRMRILQKMDLKTTAELIHYAIKNHLVA